MAVQFYFYSITAPESFFHKQKYRVLSHSHTTVLYSIQGLEKRKILTDGSSVLFYSIMALKSFFHKQTHRLLSQSHITVLYSIQGLEKGKILTLTPSCGPENVFHKRTYSVLSHSHTTVLFSIQRLKKGKILTDGSSVLFQLHHVGTETSSINELTVALAYYSTV